MVVRTGFAAVFLALMACMVTAGEGESAKLQGKWNIVAGESKGEKIPADVVQKLEITVTFDKDAYTVRSKDNVLEGGTYKVVEAGKIDLLIKKGPDDGKTQLGIYKLEDGKLYLAVSESGSKDRPTEFKSSDTVELSILEKAK